ncbi:MAG TPA: flagellar biosynthetic protein FliQ [Polyangiaceae bacterium]|jgi:flagellar biosynthetic protein FliQ|nr:flagellar biosynthetic protein FliQ [Polyangiaceae bacterium]
MTVDGALELLRNAMMITAELIGPMILTALLVGVFAGVMQTITQVNEASVSFVLKMLAVCVVLAVVGSHMMSRSIDYTRRTIGSIADVVK